MNTTGHTMDTTTDSTTRRVVDLPAGTRIEHPYMAGRTARWAGEVRNGSAVIVGAFGESFVHPDTEVVVFDLADCE